MQFDSVRCGQRIRISRKNVGMTQLELSQKLHISEKYLSRIETGRQTASIEVLVNISLTLNVSLDVLVWGCSSSRRNEILLIKEKVISIADALGRIANEETY